MELAIYEAFREAGIEEKPAKTLAATLNKAMEQSIDLKQVATKNDIEQLRAEIARIEANVIKWLVGSMVAIAGISLAVARLIFTAG